MKVLVACEYSDTVSAAFRERGHDVTSCDLLPSENPNANHIQGDVRPLLQERWDLVIAHPPCTYLTVARGPLRDIDKLIDAAGFFNECYTANAKMVAVENPLPYKAARAIIGEPDCMVHPYHFGDLYTKRTCWWLYNLPPLLPTGDAVWDDLPSWVDGKRPSRPNRKHGFHRDSKERSRFHPGMAAAMAQQWG